MDLDDFGVDLTSPLGGPVFARSTQYRSARANRASSVVGKTGTGTKWLLENNTSRRQISRIRTQRRGSPR